MDEKLKKFLVSLADSVEGLFKIFITDKEGVPITHATGSTNSEAFLRPQLLTAYSLAVEQSSKLEWGQQKHMVCMYQNYQLVMLNCSPLMVTLIASSSANTGLLLSLKTDLEPVLKQLEKLVGEVLPA